MYKLNFPDSPVNIAAEGDKQKVFDIVRMKWIVLTPEEWVRQHLIHYLISDKGCSKALMAVEKSMMYNGMNWRSDLVVYARNARPLLLAECKAPDISISPSVFDQAARYNMVLRVPYLMVTNGIDHYCCKFDQGYQSWQFLREIPSYGEMALLEL